MFSRSQGQVTASGPLRWHGKSTSQSDVMAALPRTANRCQKWKRTRYRLGHLSRLRLQRLSMLFSNPIAKLQTILRPHILHCEGAPFRRRRCARLSFAIDASSAQTTLLWVET